ncbi:MAG: PAS domain S-box protein [candidate division Zixibacteria bacterium]|nr:PAS domain S-box protein [candidate division Zixibacteria bacterium]
MKSPLIQLLDNMTDGIYIANNEYTFEYVNPSLKKIFGSPAKKKCYEYLFDCDDVCSWCKNSKIFSGKVVTWEQNFDSLGKIFEILELPLYLPKKIVKKLTVYRDITKRKETEKTLQESEQGYRTIMEASLQGMYQVDAKGFITFSNPITAELTGYSHKELIGLPLNTLFLPGEAKTISDVNVAQLYSGKSIVGENTLTRKDGSQIEVYFSCAPVINKNDEYMGFVGSVLDITERKRTEERLRQTNTSLIEEQVKLKKMNVALKEVLDKYESGKDLIRKQTQTNINRIILPILGELEIGANENQKKLTNTLRKSLDDLSSSYITQLESRYSTLTPRETEICMLIKEGYSSKEIASLLGLSVQTVFLRRKHIRKKLGIDKSKSNLLVHLKSI